MRGRIAYVSNDPVEAYTDGYAAGLDAAREAVAALHYVSEMRNDTVHEALTAIDALRAGDHSAPRQPEGYSPTATDNRP